MVGTAGSSGRLLAVLAALPAVFLVAGEAGAATGTSAAEAAATSADAAVYAAALASASFHYVDEVHSRDGKSVHNLAISGDAGAGVGVQQTTGPGSYKDEIIVTPTAVYFRGNAEAVATDLGYHPGNARRYADRWISMTWTTARAQFVITLVLTKTAWADPSVVPIGGFPQAPVAGTSGADPRVTTRIRVSRHHGTYALQGTARLTYAPTELPSHFTDRIGGHGAGTVIALQDTMTFTTWGETVPLTVPERALAYSSLPKPKGR